MTALITIATVVAWLLLAAGVALTIGAGVFWLAWRRDHGGAIGESQPPVRTGQGSYQWTWPHSRQWEAK